MKKRLVSAARGLAVAAASMAVYAIPVGCFIALMLLVISMEEGGDNLTVITVPLTEAVVLLTQGSGFRLGAMTFGIIPLLLTILLIALIAQFTHRLRASFLGWVAGTAAWAAVNAMFVVNIGETIDLHDSATVSALKAAFVFTLGYALGGLPGSRAVNDMRTLIREHLGAPVRRTLVVGLLVGAAILAVVLLFGLGLTIWWIAANHGAMAKLFTLNGMETGSAVLTSIVCVAWLPNVMIWAAAWGAGAGFEIGDIASFTMWSGQAKGLPSLPVFGLLPEAVGPEWLRITLQLVVPVSAAVIALVALLLPRAFHVDFDLGRDETDNRKAVLSLAYPAGAFCLSAVVVSVGMSVLNALSDGALGTGRLKHVGVNTQLSTQAIGRTAAMGLFVAWLAVAVALAAAYGIHWLQEHRHHRHKEAKSDDNHEPSDQEGAGISLP